jgi:predicted deacylase
MRLFSAKRIIALIVILLIISVGVFSYFIFFKPDLKPIPEVVEKKVEIRTTIGLSVEGRKIEVYTYGSGENHLLFVGGIHGGYEWNSVLLAYQFMDYLNTYPEIIPKNITVTVIPSANPDGVYKVINKEGKFTALDVSVTSNLPAGTGRFNNNGVDLNRNFDCKWQATSTWRQKIVSAGTAAFSEPEAKAIQKFIIANNPEAVIFWHSQSNAVYASECKNGILPETLNIMNTYSKASGYPAISTFDSYEITGDAEGWLSSINIPAITVELKTHEGIEWDKNIAGILALFDYYKLK